MKHKNILKHIGLGTALIGGFIFANITPAFAYSPQVTHYPLAEEAVELYNRHHPENKVGAQELIWIAEGAHDEDRPATRATHHFYDPVNNMGLESFESSKLWARDNDLQNLAHYQAGGESSGIHTWEEAIAAYNRGDKEHAYKTLGHIFHLIQDATVPAHTRQDAHVHVDLGDASLDLYGGGDPLEQKAKYLKVPSSQNMRPVYFNNLDAYFDHVATYSNNNFWSKDSVGMYELPKITRVGKEYIYTEINEEEHKLAKFLSKVNSRFTYNQDEEYKLLLNDPQVIHDYWERLAPLGIETTAGIIKLFHDSIEPEPEPVQKTSIFGGVKKFFSSAVTTAKATIRGIKDTFNFAFSTVQVTSTPKYEPGSINMIRTGTPASYDISLSQLSKEEEANAQENFRRQLEDALNGQEAATEETSIALSDNATAEDNTNKASDTANSSDKSNVSNSSPPADGQGNKPNNTSEQKEEASPIEKIAEKTKEKTGEILGDSTQGNYGAVTGRGANYYSNITTEETTSPDNFGGHLVINEIQTQDKEFVELYNPTGEEINLSNYYFAYYPASRTSWDNPYRLKQFPENSSISSMGHYLIGLKDNPNANWQPYSSAQLSNSGGTVAIFSNNPETEEITPIDAVGWGSNQFVNLKEKRTTEAPGEGKSISRNVSHADTNNNFEDFTETEPTPTKATVAFSLGTPLWGSWQNNALNSGFSFHHAPLKDPTSVWQAQFGTYSISQPLIDNAGNIYVSINNARESQTLSLTSKGAQRWSNPVHGKIALANDSSYLYVAYEDSLHVINSATGDLAKEVKLNMPIKTELAVNKETGVVYAVGKEGFAAISKEGDVIWQKSGYTIEKYNFNYSRVNGVFNPMLLDGVLYIVVHPDGGWPRMPEYLVAIDAETGDYLWERSLRQMLPGWGPYVRITKAHPVVNKDGKMFIGFEDSGIKFRSGFAVYDLNQEGPIVRKVTTSAVHDSPLLALDSFGNGFYSTHYGTVHYYDMEIGHRYLFSFSGERVTTNFAVDGNNTLYFGTNKGTVYAVKNDSLNSKPSLMWEYGELSGVPTGITIGDGGAYVTTYNPIENITGLTALR